MNEPENSMNAPANSTVEELREEVDSLRSMVSMALGLIFIFSVCVNGYLFRRASEAGLEASNERQEVMMWGNGGLASTKAIEFWVKLNDYAKAHPDFNPIINKYAPHIVIHSPKAPAPAPKK